MILYKRHTIGSYIAANVSSQGPSLIPSGGLRASTVFKQVASFEQADWLIESAGRVRSRSASFQTKEKNDEHNYYNEGEEDKNDKAERSCKQEIEK